MSIAIKPENRGKFTEYCGGKVTQEKIDKAKNSPDPSVRKMATFADNARHWAKKGEDGLKIEEDPSLSFAAWMKANRASDLSTLEDDPRYSYSAWLQLGTAPQNPQKPPQRSQSKNISLNDVKSLYPDTTFGNYGTSTSTADYIRNYLKKHLGLTDAQAEGFVINFWTESRFNPKAVAQPSDRVNAEGKVIHYSGGDSGLCQWTGQRRERFKKMYGKNVQDATLDEQLAYACWELQHKFPQTLRAIKSSKNTIDASYWALVGFESTQDNPHVSDQWYMDTYAHGKQDAILDRLIRAGYKI